MRSLSALSLFCTIVALSGIVSGEEVTRTLVAPAIGITSVSVLGVEGDETTFALYQTADDGATTFIHATNIVDVFPAPSFSCKFHETAKGKMQCIEADATSTAVISVVVQTLLYAVDDANTVVATSTSPSNTQSSVTPNTSSVTGESSVPTSSGSPDTQSTNPATGETSPSASQTSSAPSTTPSSGALPAFVAMHNKWAMILGIVAALANAVSF
ncbi:hypothetical protein B0H19DRAFT_683208 [Mycena capillaripes]|nr:hypothetical protein B0H19DRAFT_683208 [Mycena capillaripes]